MYCPNCKYKFLLESKGGILEDMAIEEVVDSEFDVILYCHHCGESYIVTIAQEDLKH